MTVSVLLGVKAEMVFGALVVTRHRPVRLAAALALVVAVLLLLQDGGASSTESRQEMVLLITSTLASLSAARLLAPGAALAASRRVAAEWWVVPFGRLLGAMAVFTPIGLAASLSLGPPDNLLWSSLAVTAHSGAIASFVLVLTPVTCASVASAVGCAVVWAGATAPSSIFTPPGVWTELRQAAGMLWHILPFTWRAQNVCLLHQIDDLVFLILWLLFGVVTAGMVSGSVRSVGVFRHGRAP